MDAGTEGLTVYVRWTQVYVLTVDVPALGRVAVERRGEQDALVLVTVVLPSGVRAVRSAELNPDAWCREQSPQTPIGNSGQTGHAGRLTLGVLEALVAALLEGLL